MPPAAAMMAMVLAAGRGERLRPLTQTTPKPLVEVGGETLLARQLRLLRAAGFERIVVNAAHLSEQIAKAVAGDNGVLLSEEEEPLGAAGGIRLALARGLLNDNAPFVAVNADIFCDYDFSRLRLQGQIDRGGCHLVLAPNPPEHPQGDFNCKDGMLQNGGAATYTGIGAYHPDMFADIEAGAKAEMLPLINNAIAKGEASCEMFDGIWRDAGTPASLADARKLAQNEYEDEQ